VEKPASAYLYGALIRLDAVRTNRTVARRFALKLPGAAAGLPCEKPVVSLMRKKSTTAPQSSSAGSTLRVGRRASVCF